MSAPRIAIAADWLPTFGGAERVIASLHSLWPQAPIVTTVLHPRGLQPLGTADIRTSWLQPLYRLLGRHQYLLPLMPRAMEAFDLSAFDVVISSSHAVGKGIVPPSHAVHICYCHTPMRYAWEMEEAYLSDFRLTGFLKNIARKQLKKLRRWDLSTAKRVDVFIANSVETQERIRRIYGRESTVIHPPVDDRFLAFPLPEECPESADGRASPPSYYLAVGRLVPYKKFDLLIEVCNRLKIPLKIGGVGQEEKRLQAMAGPTIEFLGYVPEAKLPQLYADAQALLFPQHEDAGIVPLEAQACGTPVIAYGKGGALDTIVQGTTGVLVAEQTPEAFAAAIDAARSMTFDRVRIRAHAARFSVATFSEKIAEEVAKAVRAFGSRTR